MKQKLMFPLLVLAFIAAQCSKNEAEHTLTDEITLMKQELEAAENHLDLTAYSYQPDLPKHALNNQLQNQISNDRAMLGRVLFYDKNLSKDRSVSCASCHSQATAFSDNKAFSDGIEGKKTSRNSISLAQHVSFAATYGALGTESALFWDGRARTVQEQTRATFANPNEMGMSMDDVVRQVIKQPYYAYLFRKAYGDTEVSEMRIFSALIDYVGSINGGNTRFDIALGEVEINEYTTKPFPGFTPEENKGKQLYMTHCTSCHGILADRSLQLYGNNGLDLTYTDNGVGDYCGIRELDGTFRIPGLRNLEFTAPYMHDGRFATLEAVIDHYSENIQPHPNLAYQLKDANGNPKRLHLSASDKSALIDFLKTMSDQNTVTHPKWADPFKK